MNPRVAHLFENADGIGNAGFQSVVCIYQKCAGVRVEPCVFFECSVFVLEAHDPAVGVGSQNRNVKHLSGQYIRCADASADHGSPGSVQSGVRSLSPAKAKFHDSVALGSVDHAGRLGGDQALMVDDVQDGCLHQLGLHDGGDDFDQGLLRKDHASLGDGVDISAEMEAAQILKKIFAENTQASQIIYIVIRKIQVLDIIDDLFQSCHDRVPALVGVVAEKHVEYDVLIILGLEVSLHHGQFIQVGKQRKVLCAHNYFPSFV